MLTILMYYFVIGLIFIGLYFTGCHMKGFNNGLKTDLQAAGVCLLLWPVVAWDMFKNWNK